MQFCHDLCTKFSYAKNGPPSKHNLLLFIRIPHTFRNPGRLITSLRSTSTKTTTQPLPITSFSIFYNLEDFVNHLKPRQHVRHSCTTLTVCMDLPDDALTPKEKKPECLSFELSLSTETTLILEILGNSTPLQLSLHIPVNEPSFPQTSATTRPTGARTGLDRTPSIAT